MNPEIKQALDLVLTDLKELPLVKEYQALEKQVDNHAGLQALEAEMKAQQQAAVNFAHYGKQQAEGESLKAAQAAQAAFEAHPLVIAYREKLVEVNDLIQYLTSRIQKEVNDALESE